MELDLAKTPGRKRRRRRATHFSYHWNVEAMTTYRCDDAAGGYGLRNSYTDVNLPFRLSTACNDLQTLLEAHTFAWLYQDTPPNSDSIQVAFFYRSVAVEHVQFKNGRNGRPEPRADQPAGEPPSQAMVADAVSAYEDFRKVHPTRHWRSPAIAVRHLTPVHWILE